MQRCSKDPRHSRGTELTAHRKDHSETLIYCFRQGIGNQDFLPLTEIRCALNSVGGCVSGGYDASGKLRNEMKPGESSLSNRLVNLKVSQA